MKTEPCYLCGKFGEISPEFDDQTIQDWPCGACGTSRATIIIPHTKHEIETICDTCGKHIFHHEWTCENRYQKWGHGELPRAPYHHEYIHDNPTKVVNHIAACDTCVEKRELSILCEKIPSLASEVISRQRTAFHWLVEFNREPREYEVVHASSGYNPKSFSRDGTRIGYTNSTRHGFNVDSCYLVRKDRSK